MNQAPKILLVGCGNMGQALLKGWLKQGWSRSDIQVVEPNKDAQSAIESLGVEVSGARVGGTHAEVVVLAVKPQQLKVVLSDCLDLIENGHVFLSIAAGRPIAFYEAILGSQVSIVRGMPNMPAAIGQGMTALVGNSMVDHRQHEACEAVMAAIGRVAWLEDESLMNAVTGVSGSGPAYVFLLIESLIESGIDMGLSRELATELALTTVAGASALANSSGVDAEELRRQVTSPGGTTEAALAVLTDNNAFLKLMKEAVRAATERGQDLA
jgi:pyrroline-5-carboxylate reductase